MNPSPKKWHSIRNDQRVEIGLVQVDIGDRGKHYDQITDLLLTSAKDELKDALVRSAERRGGKLASWVDDGGTFMFQIDGPDSFHNCCEAAIEMLEQLPSIKQEMQLSPALDRLMMVRIACDTGTIPRDPEAHNYPGEFVDQLKKHEQAVSVENKVTITERLFRKLNPPWKSKFVKWRHSDELGVDLYTAITLAVVVEQPTPAEDPPTPDPRMPTLGQEPPKGARWRGVVSDALKSRKLQTVGAVVLLALVIFGLVRFLAGPTSPPTVLPPQPAVWTEQVQSEEWRNWRKQVHEKLSVEKVNENTLAEAFKIKLPARPEHAAAALRRDQAIADVLMNYSGVKDTLWKRFGIDEHNFLGTGLSKPSGAFANYGAASVHEYLIKNLPDNHPSVWWRILDPNKMTMTVQELFENDPMPDEKKKQLVENIVQRVKDKDTAKPAVIRFARLNAVDYSRKLGRPERLRVFASNLAEVWTIKVPIAADLSGHTFTKGDTVYVWVFLPHHAVEVVPATWGDVLIHLPEWLSEFDKN